MAKIPPKIWAKLTPAEQRELVASINSELKQKTDEALEQGKKKGLEEGKQLTAVEKKALMLIYNEMPTYAAQPTKELNAFHSWVNALGVEDKIQILKSLAILDPLNGAKMISDIVEREISARIVFVRNSGLLM